MLFHGLGSGKTLSAIGVSEEMRVYLKQMGIKKRIIIVAAPNIQDNFRLQLFDERKLKMIDGLWTMRDAIGIRLLKEINPMNMKGYTKEKIISQIRTLINNSYLFLGTVEFANYIEKTQQVKGEYKTEKERKMRMLRNLQNEFDNRLIVIDEVHNIRIADNNENKKVADKLTELVKSANNMRLLLLSATPMYNSFQEIVWLLNLMNINDRRGTIEIKDVFDKNGNFKTNSKGEQIGKQLLIQKATGYVSFVRGENPYTFPFRVYPNIFSPQNTFSNSQLVYPTYQMNGKKIKEEDKLKILALYMLKIGTYQSKAYQYIIDSLRKRKITVTTKTGVVKDMPSFENMESFGYTLLQIPIEALNIVYPIEGLDDVLEGIVPIEEFSEPSVASESASSKKTSSKKKSSEGSRSLSPSQLNKTALHEFNKPFLGLEYSDSEKPVEPQRPLTTSLSASGEGEVVELIKKPSSEPSVSSFEFEPQVSKNGGTSSSSPSANGRRSRSTSSSSSSNYTQINVHDLTGKKGLERMMHFIDKKSPPEKGSFEYKKTTLDNYGRIFSPSEIGKYSSKIKNICQNIVSDDGVVDKGVIMIYAQYIDAGVIPVALALEEMGFTRYGDGAKSLFKTPPTEMVDARTMKPRASKKSEFSPARYALITGDVRLSPNNSLEVKAATSVDNKEGNKIKVVIISQAGAEGIDFKFLRQAHILQPWYNMSRIEQIIGRAVRNLSHKDLPFEERNVEIFLHGTLLEDEKEESADLYIYRVAEYKAVQIGKVTRLLKETAVDCIINHDQTNFTQDIMAAYAEGTVKQILSNGMEVDDFKVGDAPYSAACDYMENCNYKCYPDKKIEEFREDSYNENFIMMNSEKIIQKIRLLMKERFFYKKKDLIFYINTPRPYPLVQIYAALTQLIEDTAEKITDKYGRSGYLVNIGEYYLFQPSELTDHDISIFDRSVAIDFKHGVVEFEIKPTEDITKPVIDTRQMQEVIEEQRSQLPLVPSQATEIELMKEIRENFDTAVHFARTSQKIPRGDENWYKHCGITMKKLIKEGVPENDVLMFLVEHIVDMLLYKEKVELLNYLYSLEVIHEHSLEKMMKDYLDNQIITTRRITGTILFSIEKRKIILLDKKTKRWVDAEPEDELEIATAAAEKFRIPQGVQFNTLVGFIDNEKNHRYLVFKTKQTDAKRNTGARCDEAVKGKKLQILNMIVGEERYTKENTKGMVQSELCSLQEFLLRYYNKIVKNNKLWFLNFEMAKLYKM